MMLTSLALVASTATAAGFFSHNYPLQKDAHRFCHQSSSCNIAAVLLLLLLTALPQLSDAQCDEQPLELFEIVGDGACMDCSPGGTLPLPLYDYIRFEDGTNSATITSVDDCKRLCTACAVEVSSRVFRGFVYYDADGISPQQCYCYFDDDTVDFTMNECENIVTTC